jgi:light-harvesting complex 1 beta chain
LADQYFGIGRSLKYHMGGISMSDGSLTGLSNEEAKEVHSAFMSGFLGFTGIAVIAHILIWMWRPWF